MIQHTPKDRLNRATRMAKDLLAELQSLREEYDALREQAPELLGFAEVCDLLQVSQTTFQRRRSEGQIPAPIANLASGPVWLKAQFTFPNTLKEAS